MLINEAILLSTILDRIAPKGILDIGSSSRAGREIIQPHIAAAYRGHHVVWTDADGFGDTLKLDITDASTLQNLPAGFQLVTACSVLEHVVDIDTAIQNLRNLTHEWLIVSVPYMYPKHDCPIDNMWRPNEQELAERVCGDGVFLVGSYLTAPEQFGPVSNASASLVVAYRAKVDDGGHETG